MRTLDETRVRITLTSRDGTFSVRFSPPVEEPAEGLTDAEAEKRIRPYLEKLADDHAELEADPASVAMLKRFGHVVRPIR